MRTPTMSLLESSMQLLYDIELLYEVRNLLKYLSH
jgi:hypothetical protein